MGPSRREGTKYHEGAKPEDGRRSHPRLFVILACEGRTLGADLGLTELLEQVKHFMICPKNYPRC
jgi:hypothetical protein